MTAQQFFHDILLNFIGLDGPELFVAGFSNWIREINFVLNDSRKC